MTTSKTNSVINMNSKSFKQTEGSNENQLDELIEINNISSVIINNETKTDDEGKKGVSQKYNDSLIKKMMWSEYLNLNDREDIAISKSSLLDNYDPNAEQLLDAEEDILNPANYRLAIKPIDPKYEVLWKLHKKQADAYWTPEEIDFAGDAYDFANLTNTNDKEKLEYGKNIQKFIKMVLAFFAGADSIVTVNIQKNFSKITIKEANVMHTFQAMMENVHGETYADMLINIVKDSKEREELINAFKNVRSIKLMIDWANRWLESERRIGFFIVAFAIFEVIFFSGAFASIYWLKKILGEDKMKGLIQSNNLIARDEGMHGNFSTILYSFVKNKLSQEELSIMVKEAVTIAKMFYQDALPVKLIGMNSQLMSEYVEYVADMLCGYLGYEKIYNTKIPETLKFMETIGFLNKDNFFERRTAEYQKSFNTKNKGDWQFNVKNDY